MDHILHHSHPFMETSSLTSGHWNFVTPQDSLKVHYHLKFGCLVTHFMTRYPVSSISSLPFFLPLSVPPSLLPVLPSYIYFIYFRERNSTRARAEGQRISS